MGPNFIDSSTQRSQEPNPPEQTSPRLIKKQRRHTEEVTRNVVSCARKVTSPQGSQARWRHLQNVRRISVSERLGTKL